MSDVFAPLPGIEITLREVDMGFSLRALGVVVALPGGDELKVLYEDRDGRPSEIRADRDTIVRELRHVGYLIDDRPEVPDCPPEPPMLFPRR